MLSVTLAVYMVIHHRSDSGISGLVAKYYAPVCSRSALLNSTMHLISKDYCYCTTTFCFCSAGLFVQTLLQFRPDSHRSSKEEPSRIARSLQAVCLSCLSNSNLQARKDFQHSSVCFTFLVEWVTDLIIIIIIIIRAFVRCTMSASELNLRRQASEPCCCVISHWGQLLVGAVSTGVIIATAWEEINSLRNRSPYYKNCLII